MSEGQDGIAVPPAPPGSGDDAPAGDLGITVALDQFSGPMDLLLYLVRKAEVDVKDLPITAIADQFADWVAAAAGTVLDLEAAGDFVVMAATLLEIKARLVAPPPEGTEVDDDGEDPFDPRAGLIRKLLVYRAAKEAAFDLDRRDDERRLRHERGHREVVPDDPGELETWELKDVSSGTLATLWFDLLKRINGLGPRTVIVDDVPMGVRMAQLAEELRRRGEGRLSEFFAVADGPIARVGMVMAVLECTRQRLLTIAQAEQYADVLLRFRPEDQRAVVQGDPGPPELLPKRQRRPPLVTWSGRSEAESDDETGEDEAPPENEEQRFLRELEGSIGVERLLSRAADLERGFIDWWEETHPGEPLPAGVVKPEPPPPPPAPPPPAPAAEAAEKPLPPRRARPPAAPATPTAEAPAAVVQPAETAEAAPKPVPEVPQPAAEPPALTTPMVTVEAPPPAAVVDAPVVLPTPVPEATPAPAAASAPAPSAPEPVAVVPPLPPVADAVTAPLPEPALVRGVPMPPPAAAAPPQPDPVVANVVSFEIVPLTAVPPQPLAAVAEAQADVPDEPEAEADPIAVAPAPEPESAPEPEPESAPEPAPAPEPAAAEHRPPPPVAAEPPPPPAPPPSQPPPTANTPPTPAPTTTPTPTPTPMPSSRRPLMLALAALWVVCTLGLVAWAYHPAGVLAVSGPHDAVVARDREVVWTLNLPLDAEHWREAALPTVEPVAAGSVAWRDARSCVFTPAGGALPPAAQVTLRFSKDLRAQGGFRFAPEALPVFSVRTLPGLSVVGATASSPAFHAPEIALRLNRIPGDPVALLRAVAVSPEAAFTPRLDDGCLRLVGAFVPGTTYRVVVGAGREGPADDQPMAWQAEVAIPPRTPGVRLVAGVGRRVEVEAVNLSLAVIENAAGQREILRFVDGRAAVPTWLLSPGENRLRVQWPDGGGELVAMRHDLPLDEQDGAAVLLRGTVPVIETR